MDEAENQVTCVYLTSLWIDMKRAEPFMHSENYKDSIYKLEEDIAQNLQISLRETRLMLDRKLIAQDQKGNFYFNNQPNKEKLQNKEKIKKEVECIKERLGIINEMVVKINRSICEIENVNGKS